MKFITKNIIWTIFFVLIVANVVVFLHSIKLGDELNHFEREMGSLRQENLSLENKLYDVDSLQYAASIAAKFDFSEKAQPVYLENFKFAKNQ